MYIQFFSIQSKCDPGTATLIEFGARRREQRFDFAPLQITVNRFGEDGVECLSMLVVHGIMIAPLAIYESII